MIQLFEKKFSRFVEILCSSQGTWNEKIEVRSNGFQIKSAQHHNVNYYSELMVSNFPD